MSIVLISTVLSLLSAVVVAVLSHLFAIHRKRTDELAQMRLKSYADFIDAASRLVSARRTGKTRDELDELAALNDAKTRICICADAPVVERLIEFWKAGGTLEQESEIIAFSRLCIEMRESLGNKTNEISSSQISDTLFKLEPSRYSFGVRKDGRENHGA